MADIYGANLYNRHLQMSRRAKAQRQAQRSGGGTEAIGGGPEIKSEEANVAASVHGAEAELPEGCSSILVCTGVYSREQEELPSDSTHTVTKQQIFHGHRDFRFDPSLTQPSSVVQDVKEAVELVFQKEGWPLH